MQKQKGIASIIFIIVIVALLAVAGFFAYKYYFGKSEIRSAKSETNSNVQNLNIQNQQKQASNQQADNVKSVVQTDSYFEIKELGLKFKITDDIKDLEYLIKNPGEFGRNILFSTKSLANMDIGCSLSDAPIGTILVTNIAPNPGSYYNQQRLLLADNGSYVYYDSPQSTCSTNTTTNNLQTKQIQLLKNALKTITKIIN